MYKLHFRVYVPGRESLVGHSDESWPFGKALAVLQQVKRDHVLWSVDYWMVPA